jgi:hypothetical protein
MHRAFSEGDGAMWRADIHRQERGRTTVKPMLRRRSSTPLLDSGLAESWAKSRFT